jgi:anti-sigma factor RsiW
VNRDEHRTIRESLGAYALGQLPRHERIAVRAHLDGCAACRAELAEIEPVVGPLGRVDPGRLDATPVPPQWLGDRIVARARAEGGPRRSRRGVLVAAVAAALTGVAGAGWATWPAAGPRSPASPSRSGPPTRASTRRPPSSRTPGAWRSPSTPTGSSRAPSTGWSWSTTRAGGWVRGPADAVQPQLVGPAGAGGRLRRHRPRRRGRPARRPVRQTRRACTTRLST